MAYLLTKISWHFILKSCDQKVMGFKVKYCHWMYYLQKYILPAICLFWVKPLSCCLFTNYTISHTTSFTSRTSKDCQKNTKKTWLLGALILKGPAVDDALRKNVVELNNTAKKPSPLYDQNAFDAVQKLF